MYTFIKKLTLPILTCSLNEPHILLAYFNHLGVKNIDFQVVYNLFISTIMLQCTNYIQKRTPPPLASILKGLPISRPGCVKSTSHVAYQAASS